MNLFKILKGQNKSLIRDPMSLFMFFLPFLLFVILNWGYPFLQGMLIDKVDLSLYYGFTKLIFYILTPTLLGIVSGLLLMDERDQDVLSYIAVTPFSLSWYILLKTITGACIGFLFNLILAILLRETLTINIILTLVLSSLLVPFFAFSIFAFAKNKVEGLTKGKLLTFVVLGAVIPHFSSSNWTYLAGILPTFWLEKIFFADNLTTTILFFIPGLIISASYILLLKKKVG